MQVGLSKLRPLTTVRDGSGLTAFVGWDRLRPYLEEAIGLKPHEQIVSVEVSDQGLDVRLSMTVVSR